MTKRQRFNYNWLTVRSPELGKDVELDKPSIYRKKSISQHFRRAVEYYKTEQEKREPRRY